VWGNLNGHSMSYAVHSACTQGKLLQIKQCDLIDAGLADILMLFFIIKRLDSACFLLFLWKLSVVIHVCKTGWR
jgi:hypothetical protein